MKCPKRKFSQAMLLGIMRAIVWPKWTPPANRCSFVIAASVHQQSPIIDRVAAATPPTLSNLSSDSAYDKFRLLNGHHVSLKQSQIRKWINDDLIRFSIIIWHRHIIPAEAEAWQAMGLATRHLGHEHQPHGTQVLAQQRQCHLACSHSAHPMAQRECRRAAHALFSAKTSPRKKVYRIFYLLFVFGCAFLHKFSWFADIFCRFG